MNVINLEKNRFKKRLIKKKKKKDRKRYRDNLLILIN